MSDSDQQVIERIRGGETRQYAILVDRYKDRAMTLAVRLVGNRDEAEELLQDAFMRAFRGLNEFRGDAKFSTWFYRIVYNLCMTRVSRRRVTPESLDGMDERPPGADPVGDEPSALERLEEEELRRILFSEIGKLPEKYKVPIILFYIQEMSYEDIAATLEQPIGTVKTNLFRGRDVLRQAVVKRTEEDMRVT